MRIVLGADHAGFELKQDLVQLVKTLGHETIDVGTDSNAAVDYPDFAAAVGHAVREGRAELGILICGSGVGASVAANKIRDVRAGLCHDCYSAHQGVEHDDMNVIVFGARIIGPALAYELADAFIKANFIANEERFTRRFNKVKAIESRYMCGQGSTSKA